MFMGTLCRLFLRSRPNSFPLPFHRNLQDISDINYTLNLFGLDLAAQFQVRRQPVSHGPLQVCQLPTSCPSS